MTQEKIETESDFREYLKLREFSVNEKHDNENGIDIVAIKNGQYFLIEVKKVTPDKSKYRARLDSVSNQADFVIVIGNNGKFYPASITNRPFQKIVDFMEII